MLFAYLTCPLELYACIEQPRPNSIVTEQWLHMILTVPLWHCVLSAFSRKVAVSPPSPSIAQCNHSIDIQTWCLCFAWPELLISKWYSLCVCVCVLLVQRNFLIAGAAGPVGKCLPHCVLSTSQTPRFSDMKVSFNLALAQAVLLLKQMVSDKQEKHVAMTLCVPV